MATALGTQLWSPWGNDAAHAAQLELTVFSDKQTLQSKDIFRVTVSLTNISAQPVIVPVITEANVNTYFHLTVVQESGTPLFFLAPLGEQPQLRASATQTLDPGQAIVFSLNLNQTGLGPLGYSNPTDPSSLRVFDGTILITAQFVVDSVNEPTGGDTNVFRGTVVSQNPATVAVTITPVGGTTLRGDINCDGKVNVADLMILYRNLNRTVAESTCGSRCDLNGDGRIDVLDIRILFGLFGQTSTSSQSGGCP